MESVYGPLDQDTEEIRLLTLHPALTTADGSTLQCALRSVALLSNTGDSVPAYEALSYVWGKPDFSRPILIDGREVHVTPSLANILYSLRDSVNPRTIWVDAVCINQADLEERAKQVRLMHKIYSSCQRVLAWMGPSLGTTDFSSKQHSIISGMKLLQEIVERRLHDLRTYEASLVQQKDKPSQFLQISSENEVPLLSELLKHSPYWRRVWIVQELVCAPRITMICGEQELEWTCVSSFLKDEPYFDAFHTMKTAENVSPHSLTDFGATLTEVKQIEDQRRAFRDGQLGSSSDELFDVLARFRDKQATDPRDKIYALMGLLRNKPYIEIDYASPLVPLYRETTEALMRRSRNLDIICQNPFETRESSFGTVSSEAKGSWTADFGLPSRESPSILFAQRDIFNAGIREFREIGRTVRDGKEVLILSGIVIDSINLPNRRGHETLEAAPNLVMPTDAPENYSAWSVLQRIHRAKIHCSQENAVDLSEEPDAKGDTLQPESAIRAFWRTMIRDCTAPPMMRRLKAREIERLDIRNTLRVESQTQVQTLRLHNKFDKHKYSSTMSSHGHAHRGYTELPEVEKEYTFATTLEGLFVLTRRYVHHNDVVAVLDGGKVPVILRRTRPSKEHGSREFGGSEELYKFICVAYVHGIMDGEIEQAVSRGWMKKRDIMLV
ncbi:heterokaryon incompatibility protein-domain-containing protein [Boeremia exigua]|uniref:heterokaryon incompatibility protein-domain-containing protein n=1 Tax=Boeremia exigua TaxID=749465 RepID=UPI001E8E371D|nr:heterokaryon incompatibility protein-domain-containing protein [Boeremia exigua]KAH6629262.1 heterokaryon incompatibility protein-domain-containing protein [Boeremia exigua]